MGEDRGSFTIEAVIAFSLFMFAYISIISLAAVVKLESSTQYAINQTAQVISQYCYLAERTGVLSTKGSGEDIYDVFGTAVNGGKDSIASLGSLLIKNAGKELAGKAVAQMLCRSIVPGYIASDEDAESVLKRMGVVNGLDGLDFRLSSLLNDGRSINIVLVYSVKPRGFGIFNHDILIRQTASTAAWITGVSLNEAGQSESIWQKDNFERGREFVSRIKAENGRSAVKPGKGIDLYKSESGTFTSVCSVNIFSASYSDYISDSEESSTADDYKLKSASVKKLIKGYANDLNHSIDKLNEIEMEDGTVHKIDRGIKALAKGELIIVVPEEAKNNRDILEQLNRIAKEVEEETGVRVNLTYRESALGV